MSRYIIFSRHFPGYHPRKGDPTFFVEKIWKDRGAVYEYAKHLKPEFERFLSDIKYNSKGHTIRAGNRWKVGDWFSPRVWSGKPYRSKQIIIGPDIQVKNVWPVIIDEFFNVSIPDKDEKMRRLGYRSLIPMGHVALNDGLSLTDFKHWFAKPLDGQIICWSENVNY